MVVCVCVCVHQCVHACVFRWLIISKYLTQNNKKYLYSFNLTLDVQAQIFKEGLTVGQMNYRNLGPEMRNGGRSVTIDLIN